LVPVDVLVLRPEASTGVRPDVLELSLGDVLMGKFQSTIGFSMSTL